MTDARVVVLGMENAVHEAAEFAAALSRLALANFEEGLVEAERAGIYRIASVVQERANRILAAWHQLDEGTSPDGGVR